MPTFIGTAPDQVPVNGYLGPLAYRDESPAGSVVGTTDTQTLTNKTIEAGTFTNGYTEEVYSFNTGTAD